MILFDEVILKKKKKKVFKVNFDKFLVVDMYNVIYHFFLKGEIYAKWMLSKKFFEFEELTLFD